MSCLGRTNCGPAPAENEEVIVKGGATPERPDRAGELVFGKGGADLIAGRVMERHVDIPGGRLGESLRQMREPEAGVLVARTITNHENAVRCDACPEPFEQAALVVREEIMQEIEKNDVTRLRHWFGDVLFLEIELAINVPSGRAGARDLATIAIDPADRAAEISLAQIKAEQPDTATEIEQR